MTGDIRLIGSSGEYYLQLLSNFKKVTIVNLVMVVKTFAYAATVHWTTLRSG